MCSFMFSKNPNLAKKQIIELLKKHPEGLTIQNLSDLLGWHRQTVIRYVSELIGADIVYRRDIGSVALHYLKETWERLKK